VQKIKREIGKMNGERCSGVPKIEIRRWKKVTKNKKVKNKKVSKR